jgi:HD superfamily phosphohydrolase
MKIFNDPIYGFISIRHPLILKLIDHKYFQRLNRIKQLGLSYLVYPGAHHTRFHHVLGAMHLMQQAVTAIRDKGNDITEDEERGVLIAILLHDIGHGPFSHALEHSIVNGISHEDISIIFMDKLNEEFNGELTLGIEIFKNTYSKKYLHQLVSSQLDMDRLDYLKRDSFYSGVSEGVVSSDRIINMLSVFDDELVIEEKGIYSIEKFIVARRLMYWQVYLHKTVLAAESVLVQILKRAKYLAKQGVDLFASPDFKLFLYNDFYMEDFLDLSILNSFSKLDDYDIYTSIKVWCSHPDFVLSELSKSLIDRELPKIKLTKNAFDKTEIKSLKQKVMNEYKITEEEAGYFVFSSSITNNAYTTGQDKINILFKNGDVKDITQASDNFNIQALTQTVEKYYLCFPKEFVS